MIINHHKISLLPSNISFSLSLFLLKYRLLHISTRLFVLILSVTIIFFFHYPMNCSDYSTKISCQNVNYLFLQGEFCCFLLEEKNDETIERLVDEINKIIYIYWRTKKEINHQILFHKIRRCLPMGYFISIM